MMPFDWGGREEDGENRWAALYASEWTEAIGRLRNLFLKPFFVLGLPIKLDCLFRKITLFGR